MSVSTNDHTHNSSQSQSRSLDNNNPNPNPNHPDAAATNNNNNNINSKPPFERKTQRTRHLPEDGISLADFMTSPPPQNPSAQTHDTMTPSYWNSNSKSKSNPQKLKFFIKTYGCQMNSNDSDIVRAVLLNTHKHQKDHQYEEVSTTDEADVVLLNTCAIREHAEMKVWHKITELSSLQTKFSKHKKKQKQVIGVLGCMAERLKDDLFQSGQVDLVAGPDAYRDLPNLLGNLYDTNEHEDGNRSVMNVQLSLDETYADITPVRKYKDDVSAFVSIMRGCNNMCSYCVVPFTRGRERSREMTSILEESLRLFEQEGVKELCLLGQNVNSYHDASAGAMIQQSQSKYQYSTSNDGFSNLYRLRGGNGGGYFFADLLEGVSNISPELRVRFTSPHPKDYPPELLQLMAERSNICNQLHMPAQSGSNEVLRRMRRGYTREAYLELIENVRSTIGEDVAISSDFISGFCGETDQDHADTIDLMERVVFDQAFMFAYSMREKTHAHRKMEDNVPHKIKKQRLAEVIDTFQHLVQRKNEQCEVGKIRLVLVEGKSRKSTKQDPQLNGRTDQNKRVYFKNEPCSISGNEFSSRIILNDSTAATSNGDNNKNNIVRLEKGDYAAVLITEARGHTLRGEALWRTTSTDFYSDHGIDIRRSADVGLRTNI